MAAEERLAEFRADLLNLDSTAILNKFIYVGSTHLLSDGLYAELKAEVSAHFGVHLNDVLMVGSGKLGFSIKPDRRYGFFHDDSDIDIVIISRSLFETIWKALYEYDGWWPQIEKFKRFHFMGWIRPDKLPPSHLFATGADWWDFFRNLTAGGKFGPYKIRAGLYYDWFFLEAYQRICIEQCIKQQRAPA